MDSRSPQSRLFYLIKKKRAAKEAARHDGLKDIAGEPCGANENPAYSKGGVLSVAACYQRLPFSGPFSGIFHPGIGRAQEVCILLSELRTPFS